MRILTISGLYPNAQEPLHGVFVENRLRQLVRNNRIDARVVAPVPWFPFAAPIFGRYGTKARIPRVETRHGLALSHPRFLQLPKLGMSLAPLFLYLSLRQHVGRALKNGEVFDLIDAHYVYPDGVAAAWLGSALRKPVVITARGSDLQLIPRYRIPRLLIKNAFRHCAAVVAVSQALADCARTLASTNLRIEVFRNGVDLELFRETDRQQVRRELKLLGPTLISVGNLIPLKGHELVIEALSLLSGVQLLIVGDGSMRAELGRKAQRLGVTDRVCFLGQVAHEELNRYYSAADVLVLASSREGWPNVLLEAMACGTPVVATAVGGVPEFVNNTLAGRIVQDRTATALASTVRALLRDLPSREQVRKYAAQFGWDDTSNRLLGLFSDVIRAYSSSTAKRNRAGQPSPII